MGIGNARDFRIIASNVIRSIGIVYNNDGSIVRCSQHGRDGPQDTLIKGKERDDEEKYSKKSKLSIYLRPCKIAWNLPSTNQGLKLQIHVCDISDVSLSRIF
ncbi:uncharacterized protein LOC104419819 [Eucalyptus grandis]|uniref:uncharacterized protein LOC104419819 n=1 Tax=Eucalyptus grandis TaxID=71139 RepID=UPI00192E8F14|nr:uncharacterized protein LOC104419819 [Eucalyptus grandis]